MKRNWRSDFFILMILIAGLVTGCRHQDKNAQAVEFTCPMHPTVISDKQGTCPVCGMDLVRKARPGDELQISEELSRLTSAPNSNILSNVQTVKGSFVSKPLTTVAVGSFGYDPRNIRTIATRTSGRLERVYVKYPYQQVRKGQKVADLYSPELLTAQKELLYIIASDPGNQDLIASAQRKLYLLGVGQREISVLTTTQQPSATIPIHSDFSGYIVPDDGEPATGQQMKARGMKRSDETSTLSTTTGIPSEGAYVNAGQKLFRLVNPDKLWLELDISGAVPVKKDDPISFEIQGKKFEGKVDFVQPFFDKGAPFIKVRVFVPATDETQVGQLVEATVSMGAKEALWVPAQSVVDLGRDQVVFIKDRQSFKPRVIYTGARSGDSVEIVRGLTSSEEIALNANYLVDSQGFIKGN